MKSLSGIILCILLAVAFWVKYSGIEKRGASGENQYLLAHGLQSTPATQGNESIAYLLTGQVAGTSILFTDTTESREAYIGHAVSSSHSSDEDSALAPLLILVTPAHHSWLSSHTFLPGRYPHQIIPDYVQAEVAIQRYAFVFSVFQRIFSRYIVINAP
ncbi:hypothetical protein [Telluribacter sp. SYSU D00476]|uniref:hypothetical protein n=1 Tax=Telluribacter sp. SYSU D00476 TaxID=2811430 RepID=UPI001FF65D74|nr:hypothetical protein [Telluribacter sp. SYSU D00476]